MGAWHKDDSMIKHESTPRVYIYATTGITRQTLKDRIPQKSSPAGSEEPTAVQVVAILLRRVHVDERHHAAQAAGLRHRCRERWVVVHA